VCSSSDFEEDLGQETEGATSPQAISVSSSVSMCGVGSSVLASTLGGWERLSAPAQAQTEDGLRTPAGVEGDAKTPVAQLSERGSAERAGGGATPALPTHSPAGEETGSATGWEAMSKAAHEEESGQLPVEREQRAGEREVGGREVAVGSEQVGGMGDVGLSSSLEEVGHATPWLEGASAQHTLGGGSALPSSDLSGFGSGVARRDQTAPSSPSSAASSFGGASSAVGFARQALDAGARPAVVSGAPNLASGTTGGQEEAPTQLGHGERAFSSEVRPGHTACF